MNIEGISNADILAALGQLYTKYPKEERVAIWTEFYPEGDILNDRQHFCFVAVVGSEGAAYGHAETPQAAVDDAIRQAGDRDPRKLLQKKIEDTRAELAKLEAELGPVVATPCYQEQQHTAEATEPQPASV